MKACCSDVHFTASGRGSAAALAAAAGARLAAGAAWGCPSLSEAKHLIATGLMVRLGHPGIDFEAFGGDGAAAAAAAADALRAAGAAPRAVAAAGAAASVGTALNACFEEVPCCASAGSDIVSQESVDLGCLLFCT